MNQGRYQLIALDIDGTLLNSKKEITPDTEAMSTGPFRPENRWSSPPDAALRSWKRFSIAFLKCATASARAAL